MRLKIGDLVGYKSLLGDKDFQHVGRVHTILPDGIPSCREPLVMLDGKSGVVLASHCTIITDKEAAPRT